MNAEFIKNRLITALIGSKRVSRKSPLLRRIAPGKVRMEMDKLVNASLLAVDPEHSDRLDLLAIYRNTWKDSQVISEHEKAIAYLITEPFDVHKTGSEMEDKKRTALLKRPWFSDLLTIILDSEFWGYQLAEFGEQDENGEFSSVQVFPREHVRPFEKLIVIYPWDRDGISYDGHETDFFLLGMGKPEDIGKLETISREIIWKTYARSDWSEYNERFGKPFICYETDTDSDDESESRMRMAERFGRDLVGVISSDEKLTVTPVASKESTDGYKNMADFCDDQIARLMNGQTATGKEGQFVGTAEVHERVLTEFTKARLIRIQNYINYNLFPFLIGHGYKLKGYELAFESLKKKKENSVDNKSFNQPSPAKTNEPDEEKEEESDMLGFFGHARKPLK